MELLLYSFFKIKQIRFFSHVDLDSVIKHMLAHLLAVYVRS